ncbi:MAG: DUF5676 family membrane protein [Hyphomicrobiales bacterium]
MSNTSHTASEFSPSSRAGAPLARPSRIPVVPLGMSLGVLLAVTFVLCVLFDLWFPGQAMNQAWSSLLPGFTWISWSSFFLGLAETFLYGWYIALIFAPLYNLLSRKYGDGGQV